MPDAGTVTVSADDIRAVSAVFTLAVACCGPAASQVPGFEAAIGACQRMLNAANDSGMPEDPVQSFDEVAITHNEMLQAYMRADFERSEAFHLVLALVQAGATANALRGAHG